MIIGVDEDANLLWGVERRVAGRQLADEPVGPVEPPPPPGALQAEGQVRFRYRPSTKLPRYWHPYVIAEVDGRRRFVQGRLADLEARPPAPMPPPISPLLVDPEAPAAGPVHQIEPAAIPTNGVRLARRWVLGRGTDGLPVLWRQRRRIPLQGPPVSGLRFDVTDPELPSSP